MPALTKSSVGSSKSKLALGTTVCPLLAKYVKKRERISAESTFVEAFHLGYKSEKVFNRAFDL